MLRSILRFRRPSLVAAWLVALVAVAALFTIIATGAEAASSCKPRGTKVGDTYKGATVAYRPGGTLETREVAWVCTKRRPRPLRVKGMDADTYRVLGVAGDHVLFSGWVDTFFEYEQYDSPLELWIANNRTRKVVRIPGGYVPYIERNEAWLGADGTAYVVDEDTLYRWRNGRRTAIDIKPPDRARIKQKAPSWRLRVTRTAAGDVVRYAGRQVDATQRAAALLKCFPGGADNVQALDPQGMVAAIGTKHDVLCPFATGKPVRIGPACLGRTASWRPGWLTTQCPRTKSLVVADLRAGTTPLNLTVDVAALAVSDFGAVAWTVNGKPARELVLWTPGAAPARIDEADEVAAPAWSGRTLTWQRRNRPGGALVRREHTME